MKYWIQDNSWWIVVLFAILLFIASWNLWAYRDVEFLEKEAPKYLMRGGYEIIGPQTGYSGDLIYGGAVYFNVRRPEQPEYFYEIEVVEWRGVIQSFKPELINIQIIKKP